MNILISVGAAQLWKAADTRQIILAWVMWYSGSMGTSRAIEKLMYSWSQRLVYYLSSDFCYSVC